MLLISGSSCAVAWPAKTATIAAVTEAHRMMKVVTARGGPAQVRETQTKENEDARIKS